MVANAEALRPLLLRPVIHRADVGEEVVDEAGGIAQEAADRHHVLWRDHQGRLVAEALGRQQNAGHGGLQRDGGVLRRRDIRHAAPPRPSP